MIEVERLTQALWHGEGRGSRDLRDRPGRDRRAPGPERGRQDHDDADADDVPPADQRPSEPRRARRARRAAGGPPQGRATCPRTCRSIPRCGSASTWTSGPSSRTCPAPGGAAAIGHVIERCKLGEVEDRILGQLSQGLPPAGRTGRGDGSRSRYPDPRRADGRARPDPDPRGPRLDPRAGRPAHDPAFDAHHVGSRGRLRAGDHHRAGPDRASTTSSTTSGRTARSCSKSAGPVDAIRRRLESTPGVDAGQPGADRTASSRRSRSRPTAGPTCARRSAAAGHPERLAAPQARPPPQSAGRSVHPGRHASRP